MIHIRHSFWVYPRYLAERVVDIDARELRRIGITHIVFDVDKTLVPRGHNGMSYEIGGFLRQLQQDGFTVLIGSNTRRDIAFITEPLGITAVQPVGLSMKPHHTFYRRIIEAADTAPESIAMVGDHVLNDIIRANHAGFTTVLVSAMHPKHSYAYLYHMYVRFIRKHAG